MRKIRRMVSNIKYIYNELYKNLNSGFYKNRQAAESAAFRISSEQKNICNKDMIETSIRFYIDKKEVKIKSTSGMIRTLRWK